MGASDLRDATILKSDAEHPSRFHATISEDWTIVDVFGGVAMYVALRAMSEAMARPELSLLTGTALFLQPIPPGPVVIDVDRLREARNTAQLAAKMRPAGRDEPALHVQGVFGATRDSGLTYETLRCPVVPPPSEVAPGRPPRAEAALRQNIHFRFGDQNEL